MNDRVRLPSHRFDGKRGRDSAVAAVGAFAGRGAGRTIVGATCLRVSAGTADASPEPETAVESGAGRWPP